MTQKAIKRIYSRLAGLINKSVVTAFDNSTKNPRLTVRDKVSDGRDVELFEIYGVSAFPDPTDKPEALVFSPTGASDHLFALGLTGGLYRPKDGKAGEVIFWSKLDKDAPHRIHFKDDHSILASTGSGTLELREEMLKGTIGGSTVEMTDDHFKITVGGSTVTLTDGELKILTAGTDVTINGSGIKTNNLIETDDDVKAGAIRLKTHKHLGVATGGGTSQGPTS